MVRKLFINKKSSRKLIKVKVEHHVYMEDIISATLHLIHDKKVTKTAVIKKLNFILWEGGYNSINFQTESFSDEDYIAAEKIAHKLFPELL